MKEGSLFAGIPAALPQEMLQTLAAGDGVRIERIVSRGHCSPPDFWYDQDEHEWVLLVSGEAVLHFAADDRRLHLHAGDFVHLDAHERHRVEWTPADRDTIWLAVFHRVRQAGTGACRLP